MNTVALIGRLTRDPEQRHTQSGTAVANFMVAVDRRMSKKDKEDAEKRNRPTADFINVTAWGNVANLCSEYLKKGDAVGIVGRIETGSYKNNEGKTVYTFGVVAEQVRFLTQRKSEETQEEEFPF